jgi:hypothetical protein
MDDKRSLETWNRSSSGDNSFTDSPDCRSAVSCYCRLLTPLCGMQVVQ